MRSLSLRAFHIRTYRRQKAHQRLLLNAWLHLAFYLDEYRFIKLYDFKQALTPLIDLP